MPDYSSSNSAQSADFPLCNSVYNLIVMIHKKSQGLEAYKKYELDSVNKPEMTALLQKIRTEDEKAVRDLAEKLRCELNREFDGSNAALAENSAANMEHKRGDNQSRRTNNSELNNPNGTNRPDTRPHNAGINAIEPTMEPNKYLQAPQTNSPTMQKEEIIAKVEHLKQDQLADEDEAIEGVKLAAE